MTKNFDFSKAIKELEEINNWFQNTDEIDLDQGFKKLEKGKDLILSCKDTIKEMENKFIDVKKELDYEEVADLSENGQAADSKIETML